MAAVLLAAKIEEAQLTVRQIILVYTHLYRRRRLVLTTSTDDDDDDDECRRIVEHPSVGVDPLSTSLTREAKVGHLKTDLPGLFVTGPIWKDWYDEIINTENVILRQLGFTLYWIPDEHSHKFILYFLRVLQVEDHVSKEDYARFVQRAWNYCSDCCRLDLCVRFDSEVLACTAIFLTALDLNVDLPSKPVPWWQVFCGSDKEAEISTVANAALGLVEATSITAVASKAFVVSLMPEGSFNDPGSFLWESAVVAKP